MNRWRISLGAMACVSGVIFSEGTAAVAQQNETPSLDLRRIALKSGESIEIGTVYFVAKCKSIMTAAPEIEVLEGPPEVTLAIKEGPVVPRNQGCTNKIAGGTIIATATEIKETKISRLMYRVKYKTKDGDRQTANAYLVGLVP